MKRIFSRMCSGLLAVVVLLSAAQAAWDGSTWTWGTISTLSQAIVAPETRYRNLNFSTSKGPQVVHMVDFNPKNQFLKLRAGLSNGNVYGTQTVLGIADAVDAKYPGTVVAAVNADYFNFGEGVEFGIFMDEGEILTTPPDYSQAFGIKADGTSFIKSHGTIMNKILHLNGAMHQLSGVNTPHSKVDSLVLYNRRYATSTKAKADSAEVVCTLRSGEFREGGTLDLEVASVRVDQGNAPLEEGQVVLSGIGTYKTLLSTLTPGTALQVTFSFVDFWKDVSFAVAGGAIILKDGVIQDVTDSTNAPRTVVGRREDGTVVLLTLDGRQSGYSVGGSYKNAATILRDLGCVDGLNLDGGGSTTFVLRPLGETARHMLNKPSDGSARRVANAIVLCNTATPSEAVSLIIKSGKRHLLVGGTYVGYSPYAVDQNFQPRPVETPITYTVEPALGSVSMDGKLHPTEAGSVTITLQNATAKGSIAAEFVSQVSKITSTTASLSLSTEQSKTIDVSLWNGANKVEFIRSQLTWDVEGEIGTISNTGEFKAGKIAGSGNILVKQGTYTLRIPVTVKGKSYMSQFDDLDGHLWAVDAINRLSKAGIVNGISSTKFAPGRSITRADFMLLLVRMMKLDTTVKPDTPFSDVPKGAYYYDGLNAAKALGIAQGSGDKFYPTQNITREEMFTLIYRVLRKAGNLGDDAKESALSVFSDAAQISSYARVPIATLTQSGLIAGGAGGKVSPKSPTTRAEAAVMIDRIRTVTGG